jgi:putative ABC transport system ATP-binding protein
MLNTSEIKSPGFISEIASLQMPVVQLEREIIPSSVLNAESVTKIYQSNSGKTVAVNEVSFAIQRGEFVALVGPSGSGKTTMLAMLAALLSPTSGTITIDGEDLGRMNDQDRVKFRRERIGFTFQSNNLVPYLTVQENVELMLRLNGKLDRYGKEKNIELLSRLGLENRLKNLPQQLSGGEKQRVAIARSLVHNPSLVLADEPTSSLDSERAYQVVKAFGDLIHEQNKAGIMVTHDLRMCIYVDRVIQMRDGKIENVLDTRDKIDELMACV